MAMREEAEQGGWTELNKNKPEMFINQQEMFLKLEMLWICKKSSIKQEIVQISKKSSIKQEIVQISKKCSNQQEIVQISKKCF